MNKELEALKMLKHCAENDNGCMSVKQANEKFKLIKSALERLEKFEEVLKRFNIKDLENLENTLIDYVSSEAQAKDYEEYVVEPLKERNEKLERAFDLFMEKCRLKDFKKMDGCIGCCRVIDFSYKEIDELKEMLEEK